MEDELTFCLAYAQLETLRRLSKYASKSDIVIGKSIFLTSTLFLKIRAINDASTLPEEVLKEYPAITTWNKLFAGEGIIH